MAVITSTVTLEGSGLDRAVGPQPQPVASAGRPASWFEHALVVLATFVFFHQTPNSWFVRIDEFGPGHQFSNGLAAAVQFLLIIVAFARVVGNLDLLVRVFKLEPAVFFFAGLTVASTLWSADPGETLRRSVMFFAVALFASYLIMRFSVDQIIKLLAIMFSLSAVVNLGFIFALPFYGVDAEDRWTGVFLQKNALGYVAALALPTLIIAARAHRRWRLLFYLVAAVQLVLLVRSDSKTMLVAGVGPTILMAFYHLFRARRTLRGAVILGMAASSAFMLAFATANIGLLASWLDKDITLTGRVPLWESLLPVIGERPWLGHGYQVVFGGAFSPAHEAFVYHPWAGDAHNSLMQITLEVGLVGVALFLFIYVRAVARAIKITAIVPGPVALWPLAMLTTTLLISITESGMQANSLGWAVYVVAVLSVAGHLKRRSDLQLSNDLNEAIKANRMERSVRKYPLATASLRRPGATR